MTYEEYHQGGEATPKDGLTKGNQQTRNELKPTHELSFNDYLNHSAISRSDLMDLQRSPLHFWSKHIDPKRVSIAVDSPAFQFGTAVHTAVLEPDRFMEDYIEGPQVPNKNYKAWKNAKAATEKSLLLPDELTAINSICSSLNNHPIARKFCYEGSTDNKVSYNEATFITNDPVTGIELKCRADRITEHYIVDLKTTKDASVKGFTRSVIDFGYYMQAAFYWKVIKDATGIKPRGFIFVAVEKEAPFAVQVFQCTSQLLEVGYKQVNKLLAQLKQYNDALANGVSIERPWRSYSNQLTELSLPNWALSSI